MARKIIVLVTGANQGIGFETAKALVQRTTTTTGSRPYHVLIGSRDLARGEAAAAELSSLLGAATGSISALQIDVTDESSVAQAAARVRSEHGRLDVLVNNAGIMVTSEKGAMMPSRSGEGRGSGGGTVADELRRGLETNVIGAAAVTEAFLPLMLLLGSPADDQPKKEGLGPEPGDGNDDDAARLVFVGSSMGSLTGAADPASRYYRSVTGSSPTEYRVTKVAVNMLMVEYHKRYGTRAGAGVGDRTVVDGATRRIRVWTADPGPNATDLMGPGAAAVGRAHGLQGPEGGAKQLVACIVGERDGQEGRMVGAYGVSPW